MKHITQKEILKAYKTLEKADYCGFCESKDYDFLYLMVKMCKKCQRKNSLSSVIKRQLLNPKRRKDEN